MSVRLKFCGAAGTVTGSCYWVRHPDGQFLVDCGLFQGAKTLKELNYGAFPFDPGKLDFVLLTHAHIDHAGLVPKLVKQGFTGPIFATAGTRDLLSFMLPDSGYIQESEVERLNRRNARRGIAPVTPIYGQADAEAALARFRPAEYERWVEPGAGVRARFWNSGHILGAASIELEIATGDPSQRLMRLLFSGDLGPEHKRFHPDPDAPDDFDYVFCESTYGDRPRPSVTPEQRRALLAKEVTAALADNGVLLIPSFAVERTQELLADLLDLMDGGAVPSVPVFLDSPLAIRATDVFAQHAGELEDVSPRPELFRRPNVRFTASVEDSKSIARFTGGMIVLAASGMCDAGRIRHHLKNHLWRRNATVLQVGYQAVGTLGRLLAQGAKKVRIHGQEIQVRARIRHLHAYSGHADADELVAWMRERLPVKRATFLTHGEGDALTALRDRLIDSGLEPDRVVIPRLDDDIDLMKAAIRPRRAPRRLAPETVGHPDWHNELAQLTLDLRAALDGAADGKSRHAILRRVRRALKDSRRS